MFANGCFVGDAAHRFDDPDKPITWQGFTSKGPVRIGANCWFGVNCVVTSGVEIGERCVIGANSVVTQDLPPRVIAAGSPAKVIKEIEFRRTVGRGSRVRRDVPDRPLRRPGAHAGAAALGLAIVVAALAGCGGGRRHELQLQRRPPRRLRPPRAATTGSTTQSGSGGRRTKPVSPPDRVRTAVEAVLTSDDPADACGRYVTQHYLSIAYGSRQGCVQAQAPGSAARSLGSYSADIHGETATAVAEPNGGPYDGARITVTLVGGPSFQVDGLALQRPGRPMTVTRRLALFGRIPSETRQLT